MCCNNSEPNQPHPSAQCASRLCLLLAGLILSAAGGCAAVSMDTPDGFLVVGESRSEIKATSSDGALLWVRTFDDPHGGDQDFWSDALYNDLVDNRGYTLLEKKPTAAGAGESAVDGEEMLFETFTRGALHKYLIWLFVRDDTICVVEFVGRVEPFAERIETVRRSVESLSF